eukprot:228796-Rhodomonas_salina.3
MLRRIGIILASASFIAGEINPAFTGTAQRLVSQEARSPGIAKTDSFQSSPPLQLRHPSMLTIGETPHSIPALREESKSESNTRVAIERSSSGFFSIPVAGKDRIEEPECPNRSMFPRSDSMGFYSIPIGRPLKYSRENGNALTTFTL